MYLVNTWFGNETVIHKETCPHGPYENSPVGEGNPTNRYRLGPMGLQAALDAAQKRDLPIKLCKHCFGREIEGTAE